MSFLLLSALFVGLFVAVPIAAHLLKRGKTEEQVFPAAVLVPKRAATAKQRSKLEDRALLGLRSLMVLALAALGATPLAQCSRLSVARTEGASVALAIVIDDSHSMQRQTEDGETRFAQALEGAEELLASTRGGDSVALILAGAPARIALSASSDLGVVRRALSELKVTDRDTDLSGAVELARAAVRPLPHVDKRVVVLSDLAAEPFQSGEPKVWTPLKELRQSAPNCAVVRAEQVGERIEARVACSESEAAEKRQLELRAVRDAQGKASEDAGPAAALEAGQVLDEATINKRGGEQIFSLTGPAPGRHEGAELEVRLTGEDSNPEDDRAPVALRGRALVFGVVADPGKASVVTGGPTIIEQAVRAVRPDLRVRPLSILPQSEAELGDLSILVVDDPPGLSPESRSALEDWVQGGGVLVGLLGPSSRAAELASNLEPFVRGGATWEDLEESQSVDDQSMSWLGAEATTLAQLTRTGRMRLDGAELPGSETVGTWTDSVPFVLRRALGSGLVFTVGLPASVEHSDLALRPGFLGLLARFAEDAEQRQGPAQSEAGQIWSFADSAKVQVIGPDGPLSLKRDTRACLKGNADCDAGKKAQLLALDRVGRYHITVDGVPQQRVVTLSEKEVERPSLDAPDEAAQGGEVTAVSQVDISSEVALFLLLLFLGEMLVRSAGGGLRLRQS